jgi:hypothetical protein
MCSLINSMLFTWRNRIHQSYKINRLKSWVHEQMYPCANPRVALIFGCQRSGTTLLRNFIGLDSRFRDVGEGDPPYFHQEAGKHYLRLMDDDHVEALIHSQRSPWVLLKPLHDSQQAARLLKRFERSRGIWIYRHYQPVIQSHLRYYKHDALHYLAPLRMLDEASWILQGLGREVLQTIQELVVHAGDRPEDLYAVFWYVRNAQFFAQLGEMRMLVLSYEELVLEPSKCLRVLSKHLDIELSTAAAAVPHQSSLHPKETSTLHPIIQEACDQMHERLRAHSTLNQ